MNATSILRFYYSCVLVCEREFRGQPPDYYVLDANASYNTNATRVVSVATSRIVDHEALENLGLLFQHAALLIPLFPL